MSFALIGNCHPETALAMLQGTSGCQIAKSHERILFYTCPRVQPHEALPPSVRVNGLRFVWTEMPEELANLAGLAELLHDPERAALAGWCLSLLPC